ncbi:bifunctional riboflavin kinase/FAD synthetase [Adhaeribacter radiodurans]|uniref:Riboflavin biosynthesis protein n=1 Tax=Adhaeribacter radiodurans TaxID=2745197 RepID=A0A7L7L4Z1_9BACT|nr:bifunctional riboflavin kinase/FAD synthetase [Adhaeribacter radiodurans]QMU27881.1 bifunctional riboflavin kinase/FAD synthetase [Adhaeribacter radiodurans]
MQVIRSLSEFPELSRAVVTSGTFDGVHIGHQKILQRLIQIAQQTNGQSVVITYWPHPRLVLHPETQNLHLLSTIEERIEQLAVFGIDYLLIIPFTREFASLDSEQFITDILIKTIHTKKLVIGYDHRFGRNRMGSFEYLRQHAPELGFEVEEIPRQDIDHMAVSSTKIRVALENGEVKIANTYLGRSYSLRGTVVKGKQLGRTLGYPTANLDVSDQHKLIPKQGIYTVKVKIQQQVWGGMLSIGTNPTVGGTQQTIEVNIFDFEGDLYGQEITLLFVDRIRDEENYASLEELISQLHRDKETALHTLNHGL